MQPNNIIPTQPPQTNTQPVVPPASTPPTNRHEGWRSILFTIFIIALAPLFALFLTSYIFQPFKVDGESMETTLQDQDRLIIWKLPRTIAQISGSTYLPGRGDIVVFTKSDLLDSNGKPKKLIKRVVGLPGDRVVVKDGKITIYNADNPNGFNPDDNQEFSDNIADISSGNVDTTVKEGEVFVCGDNRPDSLDSRFFGTINTSDIAGTVAYRIMPLNNAERF